MTKPPAEGNSTSGATEAEKHFAFELPGTLDAGSAARRALVAQDGALPGPVRDNVLLLLTELVTNAVRHADAGPDRKLRVEIGQWCGTVKVAVCDQGRGFTEPTTFTPDETGGWGLLLVDRIADRWAVAATPTGTRVWFEIRYGE